MDGIEAKVVECGLYNENGELILPDKAITYLRECMEENTVGSTVFAEDGDLYLAIIMARYILEERQRLIKNYYNNKENNNDK